jgi:D-alanyl-D-alanine carboxypeptidase/D-alanyl-D-alanine-endopeptidase (penicillin-binding protein 4)
MKIVTLAAAADRLGWDLTYETRLTATGTIEDGVLKGDLVVIGSGDPSLTETAAPAVFAGWADRLRASGISTVDGRIVGDDDAFDDEPLGMGWSWDDLPEAYAAGVGALQFNENMARVTVAPGAAVGALSSVALDPVTADLVIHNRLITAEAASEGRVRLRRGAGSIDLEVSGSLPLGNPVATRLVSVNNPTKYFVESLRRALVAAGIDVRGPAVDIDELKGTLPGDDGAAVAAHRSPPLSTLAHRLMKNSVNQYGETLLHTLGAAAGTPTSAGGAAAAKAALKEWGVGDGDLIQRDGSGLSRYSYVTPGALVAILEHVHEDVRLKEPFVASLPVAGEDGSLANRMKGTLAEHNARAKTGSMSQVRTLAGYVTTVDGELLAFAIMANNFETPPEVVNRATDEIVVRLAQFRR